MTRLEEQLRCGMKSYAERIPPESLPPLREPSHRRPRRTVHWLAPVAAAAAIVGVIVGVSLAGQHAQRASALRTGGGATTTPVPPGPGMPQYYATVFQTYAGGGGNLLTKAEVLDSATGAELRSLTVPTLSTQGGADGADITAAANDRTFVIYETGTVSPRDRIARFFVLQVATNGRSVTLSRMRLNVPRTLAVNYVALSPNGRMLAMQEQYCPNPGGCEYTGIRVVTIATGAVRTWTSKVSGAPFNVSWAGNSQVTFLFEGPKSSGYRLLSVTGQGGNDLADSRPIASPSAGQYGYVPSALVTADGRTVITSIVSSGTGTVTAKIVELDVQTGKLVRVLYTATGSARSLDEGCNVLSVGPVGIHLLVACPDFGRLDGSVFMPLPGFLSPSKSGLSQQSTGAW
jgi:hypothetical protein